MHRRQVAVVNQVIRERGARTVLEVACGPGRLTPSIEGVERGLAVDASEEMLSIARRRVTDPAWQFERADAFQPLADRTFDLIYTMRFVWHFPLEERRKFYQAAHAMLEPGGRLLFDVLTRGRYLLHYQQMEMYEERYRNLAAFRAEMEASGFEVCRLHGYVKHPDVQHVIGKLGEWTRLHRPAVALLRAIETIPSPIPEEYVAECRPL
jgi:SAM-dependent methyltransferase